MPMSPYPFNGRQSFPRSPNSALKSPSRRSTPFLAGSAEFFGKSVGVAGGMGMSSMQGALAVIPEDLAAIEADVGRLNLSAAGLGDRAVRFVIDGRDPGVLDEIKIHGKWALGTSLQFSGPAYYAHIMLRRRALVHMQQWRPAVIYRFAAVMDAVREASGQYFGKADPKAPRWLRTLFAVLAENQRGGRYDPAPDPLLNRFFVMERVEELLEAAGEPKAGLLHLLYCPVDYDTAGLSYRIEGLADFLAANVDLVAATFAHLHAEGRERLINDLGRLGLGIAPYFDVVFRGAIGSSKTVRKAARAVLQDAAPEALMERAAKTLSGGATDERREAVDVLALLVGAPARDMLASHAAGEKSKPVRDAIAAAIVRIDAAPHHTGPGARSGAATLRALDGAPIEIPPVPELPPDTPLPAELLQPIATQIAPFNKALARYNAEQEERAKTNSWGAQHYPLLQEDGAAARFLAVLNGETEEDAGPINVIMSEWIGHVLKWDRTPYLDLFARPEVTPWHLLRLVRRYLAHRSSLFAMFDMETPFPAIRALRTRLEDGLDFRVVARILDALGEPADNAARMALGASWRTEYAGLDCATMHLYFLEHIDLVEEALGLRPQSGQFHLDEKAGLRLLAWLPQVPEQFVTPLLDLALGPRKQARGPARAILVAARDIDDRIIARLADAKREIRSTAAEWIGERGLKQAAPQLEKLLKTEKSESGRAAVITALARLGEDISEHFSEKALQAEAEKGLAKASLKSLEWFPFAALPELRWQSGARVPPVVVKWWVVLAEKLKDPAGNALFELYLDRLLPEDAERFGLFLLQAFIERDTTTCSEEEALVAAKQSADQAQQYWQRWQSQQGSGSPSAYPFDYDQTFAAAKAAKLREHLHSCSENRGLLGLTSRAPGAQAAALVRRYLKDHGNKVNQSKALLTGLARNRSPAAIQVVLAAAHRLKQKTVQALAKELVEGIADESGWTADELADRTIPSAGFDEGREMDLDCGEGRMFRALYRGEGRIDLLNPNGRAVKSLPDARREDEKETIAGAKKQLAAARKEIKQVEDLQRQRLYEAMCIERKWEPETWSGCLLNHPVVGLLCQRLIWVAVDKDDAVVASFRPLEDGSLTNHDDETVDLADAAFVKLAHQALLPEAGAKSWLLHCSDYEVRPLFEQFGKVVLSLDAKSKKATVIEDRQGWMIDNLKLQGIAGKFSYDRGDVSDGAGFSDYIKRFEGIGIRAVIEFSGSYVGANTAFPCALIGLRFQRMAANRRPKDLPLAEVPPVLLSEAWGDFHAIAAAGSGFDAEWEKKRFY
jgi:hypothetical protein